jgi:hypothetical protein
MRSHSALLATGLAIAGLLLGTPASAAVIERGHFHDTSDDLTEPDTFFCGETEILHTFDVYVNYLAKTMPGSGFPYFQETVRGTDTYTNLDTGRTFTNVFATHSMDTSIVENPDGETITITGLAAGGSRFYDDSGKMVLRDPGSVTFSFVVDFNGTPSDPEDDTEVEGSGMIIRPSTGNSDFSDRDFCEDVLTFTS